jgi:hypothetical protein
MPDSAPGRPSACRTPPSKLATPLGRNSKPLSTPGRRRVGGRSIRVRAGKAGLDNGARGTYIRLREYENDDAEQPH